MRGASLLAGALAAAGLAAGGASAAPAPGGDDPIVGRWELALPTGAPAPGSLTYDIVATGDRGFTTRVVRNWPIGCQAADDDLRLTRVGSAAAQPAYRGTITVRIPPLCTQTTQYEAELVIAAGGLARLFVKSGSGIVNHFRRISLRIDTVLLTLRERSEAAIKALASEATGKIKRWEELESIVSRLHEAARRQTDTTQVTREITAVRAEIARTERDFARAEQALRSSGDDPRAVSLRDGWEKRIARLWRQLRVAETAIAAESLRQQEAEDALRKALSERTRLDRELVAVGRRIAGLDFDIQEITATSAGKVVFKATGSTGTWRKLRELDGKIATATRTLAQLEATRATAKKAFLDAQHEVIAAGSRLVDVFWSNFAKTVAIETGSLALDLGIAWTRGSFIGLAAEVGKKAAETAVFSVAFPAKGGEADEIEAKLRAQYGAQLKDSFSLDNLARVADERRLKETVFKTRVKDPLTQYLTKHVYDPVRLGRSFEQAQIATAGVVTTERLRELERTAKKLVDAQRRVDAFTSRQALKPGQLRGLAEGLAKDAIKLALKRQLEQAERAAWIDYFEHDLRARMLYPLFRLASENYWLAKDDLDRLLAEAAKAQTERPDLAIVVNEPFARGVPLQVRLAGRGSPGALALVLGGSRARQTTGFVFVVDTAAAQLDSAGKLVLEIR